VALAGLDALGVAGAGLIEKKEQNKA